MLILTILYTMSIFIAFLVMREAIKDNQSVFEGVDFKDIIAISVLCVFPLFNLLISWRLYSILNSKTTQFSDMLNEVFFIETRGNKK